VRIRPFFAVWAALSLLVAATGPARASGPFVVTGDGRPCRFDPSQPVHYVVDAGPFGSRSHAQAVALVQQAFRTWEAVPTALLRFEAAGELPQDIDGRSAMAFLNGLKPGDASPVLLDSDGSILEVIFGRGASDESSGFAYPWWREPGSGRLLVSAAVLNAKLPFVYTDGAVLQSVIHELGHFVGLEHSQLNGEGTYDGDSTNDHLAPAMSYSWGPNSAGHLHREDEAWFSWLYPSPDFAARTGSIRGRVLLPDGATGLMGVMVVARRVDDPRVTAVSGISGYLFGTGDEALVYAGRPGELGWRIDRPGISGAPDPARLGEFLIPGLPPGSYTLELQQLMAIPSIWRRGYLIGGPKSWREGSSVLDPPDTSTPIVVNAGQEASGIDIVVNGKDLGRPRVRIEEAPNSWRAPQELGRLPVELLGAVQGDRSGASTLPESPEELTDVYRVTLLEWTTLTAVLSAAEPAVDLDLYVFRSESERDRLLTAAGIARGTPPEVLQQRLPPGEYIFGVHHAGGPGSGYTLRLLAAPAPELGEPLEPPRVNYLIAGEITETSAVLRWQTTGESAAVVYYGQPLREVGSTERGREHTLALTGLAPGSFVPAVVLAPRAAGPVGAAFTTAKPAAASGAPRIAMETHAVPSAIRPLGRDSSLATVILSNTGDGDALNVRIEQVTVPSGWEVLSEALSGTSLPRTLEMGRIGSGGKGRFSVRLVRSFGSADPRITVHGSYTDAAGTVQKF
jgi:hypothetical protein